nr:MAG TPA: hypothetical protein [Caudoviricetes sp.]DAT28781.1 MAG TPA: hypothetical protein [Caudoviricetes sp.]
MHRKQDSKYHYRKLQKITYYLILNAPKAKKEKEN